MASPLYLRSFSAGELSGAWAGRADLPFYAQAAALVRNFIVKKHGGIDNRSGTQYVGAPKTTSVDVKLVPYVSEVPGQSVLIEMGDSYFRFWLNGELQTFEIADVAAYSGGDTYTPGLIVESGGAVYVCIAETTGNSPPNAAFWFELPEIEPGIVAYEIPTPFTFPRETKWAQSGRVITFTHQSTRPRELRYIEANYWELADITTVAQAGTPQNPAVTQAPDEQDFTFEVAAHYALAGDVLSGVEFTDTFGAPSEARPIDLTWDEPTNGPPDSHYTVWRRVGGSLYLIGTTDPLTRSFSYTGQADGEAWAGSTGMAGDEPSNLDATQGPATPILSTFRYVVTAVVAGEESFASDVAQDDLEEPTGDRPHVIVCDAVTDATAYNFYADENGNGVFGFVGTSATNIHTYTGDPNPDYSHNPPTDGAFFNDSSDFPATVAHYKQRRMFANTTANPDVVKGSRVGEPNNFTISTPLQDSDAISFRLQGVAQHAVREMVPLKDLVVMTDGGAWRSKTAPGVPLTPSNLPFDQETYVGIHHDARPVVIGNVLVFVQARGKKVVDVRFTQEAEGLSGRDLTVYASRLFEGETIQRMAYQYEPDSVVWCVRSDGKLLGLTYLPELDQYGWHQHRTINGQFEDVCVVPELGEDVLYTIVRRVIDGNVVRYIERLANREDRLVFSDSAVVYDGAPITTIDVAHLEGETVTIHADGIARGTGLVDAGVLALGGSYSTVVVGLPITAELETLDADAPGSTIRQNKKRVGWAAVLLDRSVRNFFAGVDFDNVLPYEPASYEGVSTDEFSGLVELGNFSSSFDFPGRFVIRHTQPTPLSILGLLPNIEVGG